MQKDLTDETIAVMIQNGDVDVFGELMDRYENKLRRYGQKFLNNREDITDLVQDIFIKVYENIQSFDSNLRFSPWIYRVAHNIFVNELKRKSRFNLISFDPDVILPFLSAKETADEATLEADLKNEIGSLLKTLNDKYREVVVLYYFEELSYQEISDILKIPTTTVGVRIKRARDKLREAYTNSQSQK